MSRVKRGVMHSKRRRNLLKRASGYRWGRKSKIKLAKIAVYRAGQFAYADRRVKKRLNRGLWQLRLGAALKAAGLSYSRFMGALKKKKIELNRKVLSELAVKHPTAWQEIVKLVKYQQH